MTYALYNYNPTWRINKEFIDFLFSFFDRLGIDVDYFSANTCKYQQIKLFRNTPIKTKIIGLGYSNCENKINFSVAWGIIGNKHVHEIIIENQEPLGFSLDKLTLLLYDGFKPFYGYSFGSSMNSDNFSWASQYCSGLLIKRKNMNNIPTQTDEEYQSWFYNSEEIILGKIRGVYAENILSTQQLNSLLNSGLTLEEFVKNSETSYLSKISDGCYYWKIEKDKINNFHKRLLEEGLII